MKLKLLASVAAAGLFAAGAASAEPDGWYGALDAGYHFKHDAELDSSIGGQTWDWEVNPGWAAFARLGYRFNPNWRVELEGGYRSGDIGTVRASDGGVPGLCNLTPATGPCYSPEGDIESATLMANVLYDFGSPEWRVRPFVGLGVGVNRVKTDTVGNLRDLRGASFTADDSSTKFAAQAIAGLAWAVSDRANVDLTYRYLTGEAAFDSNTVGGTQYGEWSGDYDQSHTVTLGLRYAFGAEPAAPPPPPAKPAARQFVVYFDWDRSDLTAEARSVVTQAANYAKSGAPTRVLIVGYTDTSGSPAYNLGLSNRRSRTVADALVAQGVNGGVIALDGKGETNLAKPTADGVREPLNRRATIDINF
ncbi:Outer membrane protein precursor [compost metagenome]